MAGGLLTGVQSNIKTSPGLRFLTTGSTLNSGESIEISKYKEYIQFNTTGTILYLNLVKLILVVYCTLRDFRSIRDFHALISVDTNVLSTLYRK